MEARFSHFDFQSVRFLRIQVLSALSDTELIEMLERNRRFLVDAARDKQRVAVLLDFANSYSMSARQRRIQSDWNRAIEDLSRQAMLGICFVMPSAVVRGFLTAIFWVSPPVVPYETCASMQQGLTWTFERCVDAGVVLPEAIRHEISEAFLQPAAQ